MDASLLLWLVLALFLFWSVGLYNRLMRLRARALEVLGVVEKHAATCAAVVKQSLAASEHMRTQSGEVYWQDLYGAAIRLEYLLAQARPVPLARDAVQAFSSAWYSMHTAWLDASEAPADLAGPAMPQEIQDAWNAASAKVQRASGGYNQIVARYNEAIQQYPARWVARFMGFHGAGTL